MNPSKVHIEVIMAAYNNVRDMRFVFEGYLRQNDRDFTLCVTDDGSGPEVEALVKVYQSLGLNIRYLWQEDSGFRKALALNKAIATSVADYVILTDNDCIPSRHFVEDYRSILRQDTMFFGRRVDLYEGSSQLLREHKTSLESMESVAWLLGQVIKKGLKRPEMAIRWPLPMIKLWNKKKRGAIGANMAIPREALIAVNGFDNDYEGYGMEETDLVWRLSEYGLKTQTVLGRCALFHLYHPEKVQSNEASLMFNNKKKSGLMKCLNGIEKIR